jgi:REP element-mobilizing transposase RayT
LDSPTPPKCLECAKFYRHQPPAGCRVCNDFRLEEKLLCDLNRRIQKLGPFQCHAFQTRLHLAGSAGGAQPKRPGTTASRSHLQFVRDFLKSDKIKYQKALALQKLKQDPDEFFVNLKYHLLWNTAHRRQVFDPPKAYLENFSEMIQSFGELVGGTAALMWLAPDHVHIFVESEGEKSIESIVKKLKTSSSKAILEQFQDAKERLTKGGRLWDKAYFSGTIG